MSKVHITLVGGQPAPVYHGIVATEPDVVVYIYSQTTVPVVEKLRENLTVNEDRQEPLDATDPVAIMKRIVELQAKYASDEITLNISGGTKAWTHLFGREFDKMPNATVVYMDQNNILWDYRTMKGTSDFDFDMFTLFRLYGNPIDNNYVDLKSYTEKDAEVCDKIALFRQGSLHSEFNALLSTLDMPKQNMLKNQPHGTFENANGSFVEWEKADAEKDAYVHVFLKKNDKSKEIRLESPHAVQLTFNTGWFEYKVAKLLASWPRAKDVCMNCHFPFKPGVDKNEVDIIVNAGSKLLFVECKTQINATTDIDKFNSVVDTYGGTGSKALFVTDAPMKEMAKQKCEQYDMMTFSLQDSHLGMSNEMALYMLLETELFNINAK